MTNADGSSSKVLDPVLRFRETSTEVIISRVRHMYTALFPASVIGLSDEQEISFCVFLLQSKYALLLCTQEILFFSFLWFTHTSSFCTSVREEQNVVLLASAAVDSENEQFFN